MPARPGFLHIFTIVAVLFSPSLAGPAQDKMMREYGILIDNTGSMRSQFATVQQLSKSIVHEVHDHAPVSIFSFESAGIGRGSRAVPTLRLERSMARSYWIEQSRMFMFKAGRRLCSMRSE